MATLLAEHNSPALDTPVAANAPLSVSTAGFFVEGVVAHTVTYFAVGIVAASIGDYERVFSQAPLSAFMRPLSDPWVMAGPILQPLRALIFAGALYPMRRILFERKNCLLLWWVLVALGIVGSFGVSPGSIEGLIYTTVPLKIQLTGFAEILTQSLLLSALWFYRVHHSHERWITRLLLLAFVLVLGLPAAGLLMGG